MEWEAWLTLATIGLMAFALVRNLAGPDTVMLAGLTLFMSLSLRSAKFPGPVDAIKGFASEGPVTIGVLFVVAEGLRQTGAMNWLTQSLLGTPRTVAGAQARLMLPVAALSAFLNNTPIVAMFMPVVTDWCRKTGLSPSKLFIPLSYAAIMGGSCTLIGTATNIFVKSMVDEQIWAGSLDADQVHIGMFTITPVGMLVAVVGIGYVLLFSRWLLPDRRAAVSDSEQARHYTVEMLVESGSPIANKTIEKAGLRHLPGAYLMGIERHGEEHLAVGPSEILREGDRLIFVGVVDSVVELQKIRGLMPATDQVFKLDAPRANRQLYEAVVSDRCPLIGKTIRDGHFRSVYNAVVIAVTRGGEHLNQKIGDISLRPGDTLLIEAHPDFATIQGQRRDFYLVSSVTDSQFVRHDKVWVALATLLGMVLLATLTEMNLLNAALLAAGCMVVFGCVSPGDARASINWRVVLMMGAAMGIGRTLEKTGAAAVLAQTMVDSFAPFGPRAILIAVYLIAMLITSLIGPIGTVALLFPVALKIAETQDYRFTCFAVVLMMTAAASFATPTGYQTNLMVCGAGGYRFTDFLKIGMPLNLLVMAVTVGVAPMIWPL